MNTQQVDITGVDDVRQKLKNHEIDGFVLNESPQWERDDISPAILIGSSYNYFAVSKKRPDLKEELDQVMQKIERENPFYTDDLYKRYLSANSLETLTDEEQNWLEQHGAVRIGYLKNDVGISLVDTESEKPVGIINDYISLVSGYLGEQAIEFQLTGFESQEKELQALKDNRIDMIFHMNQNPYEAEQNDIVLSNTVFEINVAVLTGVKKFDENKENTVAVRRNNLLGKWYISFNYPFWKIKEVPAECFKHVVPYWPLTGWLTGGLMAGALWLSGQILPVSIAWIIAVIVRLLVTGCLHEDGLADFMDGFGGGTTRERTLAIMKDSHIGSYGVIGLIFYFLLLLH